MARVSVFGQRTITDDKLVLAKYDEVVSKHYKEDGDLVVTYVYGGAKGPQEIIANVWMGDKVLFQPWTAISKSLSRQAYKEGGFDPVYFFFRNIQIVENSDLVIIFDNGEKDAEVYKVKSLCEKKGIKYEVVEV